MTEQRITQLLAILAAFLVLQEAKAVFSVGGVSLSSGGASSSISNKNPIRVAYQGEPGAYSEKSTRELLGNNVIAIGRPDFEACFRAVASMECDYACLPVENSLGGSIHENYDLMLRYDLTIVAEHEFRVSHCLLAKPGVKRDQIKYAISHPQALAQCDNYLRGLGITPIQTYDTAGSAKMIMEGKLPNKCTPENTAAIASDLAGRTYGLDCLGRGIEDDDTNFTRFLLLARRDVVQHLTNKIPSKTSVVFTLNNAPGALYKALACFSLRDIDFFKIESRPTSASLLNYLKFKSQSKSRNKADLPRFRYCFYLDFEGSLLDQNTQNALAHLREQAEFVRVLGSYPQKSRLVGPVALEVEQLKQLTLDPREKSLSSLPSDAEDSKPLRIGVVGFDAFGQFIAQRISNEHDVRCMTLQDDRVSVLISQCPMLAQDRKSHIFQRKEAQKLGIEYFSNFEVTDFLRDLDVIVIALPLIHFRDAVALLPPDLMKGKLLVEMCELNSQPKAIMLQYFGDYPEIDLVSSHPLFGPVQSKFESNPLSVSSWDGRPYIYEKVRVSDALRFEKFLKIFKKARCQIVEMEAESYDASIADAEFVTHLTGRLLTEKHLLPATPVISKEYEALSEVADMTVGDSFDMFFGMYKYNGRAREHLAKMRDNLAHIERQLAAKEAYLAASSEIKATDRQRLIAETKALLREIAGGEGSPIVEKNTTVTKK